MLNRPAAERFAHLVGADAPEVPLTGMLGGRYRIERELGRGGMARVYLAHDVKHARNVAVKVIRSELAASLGRDRFHREIAIAARLRHPNIVPLYDSGDADGVLYFVMPYEEGPSLRARLTPQGLPAAECMSALRDVARALAYAHEQGVVHRDVKPDNVMLSSGAAVVTDFGIAKAVSVAHDGASSSTLTQLGAGSGRRPTCRPSKPLAIRPPIIARTSTRSAVLPMSCTPARRRFMACRRTRSSRRMWEPRLFRCESCRPPFPTRSRDSSSDVSRRIPMPDRRPRRSSSRSSKARGMGPTRPRPERHRDRGDSWRLLS